MSASRHPSGILPSDAWVGRRRMLFVDLREGPGRLRVPGARQVPLSALSDDVVEGLTAEDALVLLCHDGRASAGAAAVLGALGADVTWVVGGVDAWRAAELPLLSAAGHMPLLAAA